jgi:hypothetical protein
MNSRNFLTLSAALISLPLLASGCKSSGDSGKPEVDASPAAMEAMMKELGTPDENHRRLDPLVGEFRFTSTMWMEPGQPAMKDEGTCSNRWTLGNLYLESQVRGTMMGTPIEGRSYMGYDKSLKQYSAVWLDSSSTMFMPVTRGVASEDGKSITMECDALDPMIGKNVHIREVLTIQGYDHHVFTMYMTPPKSEEMKSMEIIYSRIR